MTTRTSTRRPQQPAAAKPPRIFISWSGDESKKIANELKRFLDFTVRRGEPWVSDIIEGGANWEAELVKALEETEFAIVCLTKTNVKASSIHYEVGYIAACKKPICPYLFELQETEIDWPLSKHQAKKADAEGTRQMLITINKKLGVEDPETYSKEAFKKWWPGFNRELKKLREAAQTHSSEQVSHEASKEFFERLALTTRKEEEPMKQKPEPDKKPSKTSMSRGKPAAGAAKGDTRAFTLEVINLMGYPRKGQVVVPWELIDEAKKISPSQHLTIYDSFDNPLPTQVELDDSGDPARGATLLFTLQVDVPSRVAGSSTPPYLVYAKTGTPPNKALGAQPRIEVESDGKDKLRVRLINSRLEIHLELFPKPWKDHRDFYAGAASSVQYLGEEILSSLKFGPIHQEKRCMQIADLWLFSPTKRLIPGEHTIRQPYQLISQSSGPVRASVKIASAAFDCSYYDPGTRSQVSSKCQLYREISLYEGSDYVVERLYIQNALGTAKGGKDKFDHSFKARYFTFADFGEVRKFHYYPECLGMNSDWPSFRGYGFAADAPILFFENPVPNYPYADLQYNTFSWELSPSKRQKCLHLFMKGEFDDMQSRLHNTWDEVINNPLLVKVKQ
ncbi:MAG TPA: TIR domain-containing protein [Pyrinomonadaceae bacterium]